MSSLRIVRPRPQKDGQLDLVRLKLNQVILEWIAACEASPNPLADAILQGTRKAYAFGGIPEDCGEGYGCQSDYWGKWCRSSLPLSIACQLLPVSILSAVRISAGRISALPVAPCLAWMPMKEFAPRLAHQIQAFCFPPLAAKMMRFAVAKVFLS